MPDPAETFRNGDMAYYRTLVRALMPAVLRTAILYTGDPKAATALARTAWVRVYDRRHRFDGGSSVQSWVMAVTRTACRQWAREQGSIALPRRWSERFDGGPSDLEIQILSAPQHPHMLAMLANEFRRLRPREQDAVIMRFLEGHGPAEVARAMRLTETTVRAHLGRALLRLGEALAGAAPDDEATGDAELLQAERLVALEEALDWKASHITTGDLAHGLAHLERMVESICEVVLYEDGHVDKIVLAMERSSASEHRRVLGWQIVHGTCVALASIVALKGHSIPHPPVDPSIPIMLAAVFGGVVATHRRWWRGRATP